LNYGVLERSEKKTKGHNGRWQAIAGIARFSQVRELRRKESMAKGVSQIANIHSTEVPTSFMNICAKSERIEALQAG
jgi:hypothetical protein